MTDALLIVVVSISVFMASLFSTVTGFGFALVAVPFLMPVLGRFRAEGNGCIYHLWHLPCKNDCSVEHAQTF